MIRGRERGGREGKRERRENWAKKKGFSVSSIKAGFSKEKTLTAWTRDRGRRRGLGNFRCRRILLADDEPRSRGRCWLRLRGHQARRVPRGWTNLPAWWELSSALRAWRVAAPDRFRRRRFRRGRRIHFRRFRICRCLGPRVWTCADRGTCWSGTWRGRQSRRCRKWKSVSRRCPRFRPDSAAALRIFPFRFRRSSKSESSLPTAAGSRRSSIRPCRWCSQSCRWEWPSRRSEYWSRPWNLLGPNPLRILPAGLSTAIRPGKQWRREWRPRCRDRAS